MNEWQGWVGTALVGTRQQSPKVPEDDSAFSTMVRKLNWENSEAALLGVAGAIALHQQVGQRPRIVNLPPLPVCKPDELPCCSTRTARSLSVALNDQLDLLPELLGLIAKHGQRVPPQWLPKLLAIGRRRVHLHDSITEVLGNRGRWLAAQNSAWKYVQQVELQQTERQQTELQQTELQQTELQQTELQQTKATADALRSLALEQHQSISKVADRFVQVKGHSARTKLVVTLPEQYEKEWRQCGIECKSMSMMGDRAWWLQQILSGVPLSYWKADPEYLICAAAKTDWEALLIRGWITAAQREHNAVWASALFNHFGLHDPQDYLLTGLFGVLRVEQQEHFLQAHLPAKNNDAEATYWLSLVTYSSHIWSIAFSQLALGEMIALLEQNRRRGRLLSLSTKLALTVHPQTIPEAIERLEAFSNNQKSHTWNSFIEQLVHLLGLRQAMHQSFVNSS